MRVISHWPIKKNDLCVFGSSSDEGRLNDKVVVKLYVEVARESFVDDLVTERRKQKKASKRYKANIQTRMAERY